MKVYIVEAYTAEEYENHSWVDSVWDNEEKAKGYIERNPGLLGADLAGTEYGYYLREDCEEIEVQ